MKLSTSQAAFIAKVKATMGAIAAAETEGLLNGSIVRFHSVEGSDEAAIRKLAREHRVELPC